MIIDLRSDTVTRPTPQMMEAMLGAPVGDDVFAEDPTINRLEQKAAEMFGMEAALFCPSGTMTNQLAIKVHTQPGDEVICHRESHIYCYEGGGIALNSGAQVRLIDGNNGRFSAHDVAANINPGDSHYAHTSLVAIENTTNRGGGATYDFEEIKALSKTSREHGLGFHLDGARLMNAIVANKENTKEYGPLFDSISLCLSKGLGCPVGSLLIGSTAFIKKAHRFRKIMGGGMRQAGFLAAAGIYALDHHVDRLTEDHQRAKLIGETLKQQSWVTEVLPCETNILIFFVEHTTARDRVLNYLKSKNIHAMAFGPKSIRFVTHLDFTDEMMELVSAAIREFVV
ncbi:MAG: low-specificity L-threonine aldolase [Bacteroidota bacterium]